MQKGLLDYLTLVQNDELQRMAEGDIAIHSTGKMSGLIEAFYQMDEKSCPNKQIYAEALSG